MPDLRLIPLHADHEAAFLEAVARSRELHRPWVAPPATPGAFGDQLARYDGVRNLCYLAFDGDAGPVGCINLNEIVRGAFASAYLGYYAFAPHHGRGLMTLAMTGAIDRAFGELALHRLEANIQPGNTASLALVRSLGFRREGFSPRYLRIEGEWRDHERYALTAEEWPASARQV